MTWTAAVARLQDEEETRAFGLRLAAELRPGDVVALCGPLGAGKTTLAQGLARGLGVPQTVAVNSPTFAVCNEYPGTTPVLHVDFYRLGTIDEAEDVGLRDRLGEESVALVEWADRFPEILPLHTLWIRLGVDGAGRSLRMWEGDGGEVTWASALGLVPEEADCSDPETTTPTSMTPSGGSS